jgi:hypothetical protein
MLLCLCGCGSEEPAQTQAPTEQQAVKEPANMEKIYETMSAQMPEMILMDETTMLNFCGIQAEEQDNFCQGCGSSDFSVNQEGFQTAEQPIQQPIDQSVQTLPEGCAEAPSFYNQVNQPDVGNGNVLAGIVGAFLFSLLGGLLYFGIYQLGIIAGVSGLVIFVLANFGYGLFSGTKNQVTLGGLISAIVTTIVMIYVAQYFCISFEIFSVFKEEYGITLAEAIKATPDFLAESEIRDAFIGDLVFAYVFGFIASIGTIVKLAKARKSK